MEAHLATGHICADRGEKLELLEEAILIQLAYQRVTPEGDAFYNMVEGGDFAYAPYYFCLKCWEDNKEALAALVEDIPPTNKPGDTRLCAMCQSGIGNMETVAIITLGELRRSRRMPNGKPTIYFEGIQAPEIWCAACAARLNGDVIELWEDGFNDDERDEVMYQQLRELDAQYG